ncbi:MAG TPA: ABC transporter permease subunit [Deltaproteobacteria bacterium]|nr:ABC transporter permease subunit [Deltaproteobacteria bacterium]HPR55793.1 ABC transporter permease subunit [Deltaproteobacteria bacterium]HXK46089.1 ABC transporter permease subunit [Deltaproteobacteria bacterium]
MAQAMNIFAKEFKDYFVTPIAYIVICIFLLITGWFFFATFFIADQASLRSFFAMLPIVFPFVIPAVTMRLFSEELHIGSLEMLLTLPVRLNDVIMGKFLACVAFVAVMLIPTLSYALWASFLGDLDWGPVIGGYLGAVLLGSAYSAIGIFASTTTRNQIVAFITGMVICFGLSFIDKMLFFFPAPVLSFFHYLGSSSHFENIAKGIVDTRDIIYFLSVIFVALYGSHLLMQSKR